MATPIEEYKDKTAWEKNLLYRNVREFHYEFDKDKGYIEVVDYNDPDVQLVTQQCWDVAADKVEYAKQKMIAGIFSPVAYLMEKKLMDVGMLSGYMELPKWRVKRHLKASVFNKLSQEKLSRYARIFEVSMEELHNPDSLLGDRKKQ